MVEQRSFSAEPQGFDSPRPHRSRRRPGSRAFTPWTWVRLPSRPPSFSWPGSSTGRSTRPLTGRRWVRVPDGPPPFCTLHRRRRALPEGRLQPGSWGLNSPRRLHFDPLGRWGSGHPGCLGRSRSPVRLRHARFSLLTPSAPVAPVRCNPGGGLHFQGIAQPEERLVWNQQVAGAKPAPLTPSCPRSVDSDAPAP